MPDLMNNFHAADRWQKEKRDQILMPFYEQFAVEGKYLFLDKGPFALLLQKRDGVDTLMQGKRGRLLAIEEKIVQFPESGIPHKCFCFETESCTTPGRLSPGYAAYSIADILNYGFVQPCGGIDLCVIDFALAKPWFWKRHDSFCEFYNEDTLNKSRGRLVPITHIKAAGFLLRRIFLPVPEAAE